MSDNQLPQLSGNQDGQDLLIQSPIHQLESRRQRRHRAAWMGLGLLMIGSFFAIGQHGTSFMTSILPTKQAPAFDGTVYPVEKVPNWVKLKSEEYKYSYEQLSADKLLDTPFYNADNLARSVDGLKWGNPADDAIRNQKITYSVPYMGSYRLNGKENDGSHLAIDIKVPKNTPVRSIANGVVVKVGYQATGFGKHIVVQHQDVPSIEDSNIKTTYYSSYSHLSNVLVSEGDIVMRGQNIALSGETGFATTPHVHFQIDRVEAPWHPYWAFTYQEQAAAGLDFVGALNAGLGRERALATTINPMTFVQKNLTTIQPQAVAPVPVSAPAPVIVPPPAPPAAAIPETPAPVVQPTPAVVTPEPTTVSFSFNQKTMYQLGEEITITLSAKNQQGNPVNSLDESALLLLSSDIGNLSKADIVSGDLKDGNFSFQIQNPKVGQAQITVIYKGVQTKSAQIAIVSPAQLSQPAPAPQVSTSSTSTPPVPVITQAQANRTPLFVDVSGSNIFYDAIKYLKKKGIIDGYENRMFKPDQVISRVEVLKVALKAANRPLLSTKGALSYSDLDPNAWYIPYIATAQQNGITQGYLGGFFRPNQNVTRSEFLKILLLASPVSIDPQVTEYPYPDVRADDWYAVFAQFAKQKNLLPHASDGFKPNEEITRGEVAEIIYRLLLVINKGVSTYTVGMEE